MTYKKTQAKKKPQQKKPRLIDIPKIYISCDKDGELYARALSEKLLKYRCMVHVSLGQTSESNGWISALRNVLTKADIFVLIGTPGIARTDRALIEADLVLKQRKTHIIPIAFKAPSDAIYTPSFLLNLIDTLWVTEPVATLNEGPSETLIKHIISDHNLIRISHEANKNIKSEPVSLEPSRPLNEGKLILVGRGEVGKTSIVKRLISDSFDIGELKTDGINISNWHLPIDGESYKLNIWDFGGQEIMHATHQFFLTERSLYLLVINGREGGEDIDIDYWLKHIQSFGGESPVIVVLNKFSQHQFDLNYRGLQLKYPQIRTFVKTDCKDRIGMELLRKEIEKAVLSMPEIKFHFPSDWFKVKNKLESIEKEYISFSEFQMICYEEGVKKESDTKMLCWLLHCLGISLNYKDDLRLRDTSVLKPEWVTQGIYKIINAQEVFKKHGELCVNDLSSILPEERYPKDRQIFLLELMRKFSLCFAFAERPDRYLVPELLGKEEPSEITSYKPSECLNFEYHYGVFPEGLMPRFIVRSHVLSQGQERWRTGVILKHENCTALVTGIATERRVIIRIKGGNSGARRQILAIIRYDFDKINSEFKDNLEVKAKVPLLTHPDFSVDYKKLVAFEHAGKSEFSEYLETEGVIDIKVDELLNGVDLEAQRRKPKDGEPPMKTLFFSYSHKDEALRNELEVHLKLLQRQGVISTWHDRKIIPGEKWDGEIDKNMQQADIILLLISADFIASDYCWNKEVKLAIERYDAGSAIVIPIFLRACDWSGAPFAKIQGLPTDAKPVTSSSNHDEVWTSVATSIRELVTRKT